MGIDVETLVDAVDDAAEEAAFESGFNGTDLEPAPEEPKDDEPAPGDEPAATDEGREPEPAKPLSVEDLQAMLQAQQAETQKLRDTLFGKIGNLQQKIDSAKSVSTGLSAKARERLQADFPELAEMLFDNDSSANDDQGGYEPPAQTFHPSNLPDVEEVKQTFERKLLNRDHPDWQTVVASEKFAAWKASELKPEEAAELDESWDADFVSSKIRDYKAWLAKQTQKAEADRLKQERLDNATTPRGIPRGPGSSYSDDDEEAMMLQSFGKRN